MKLTKQKLAELIKEELENEGYKPKGKAYKMHDDEDSMEESSCNSKGKAHKRDDSEEYMEETAMISEEAEIWLVNYLDKDKWVDLADKMLIKGRWKTETLMDLLRLRADIKAGKREFTEDEMDLIKLSDPGQRLRNESTKITISQLSKLIAEQVVNPISENKDFEDLLTTISDEVGKPGNAQEKLDQIITMINSYFGS